MSNLSNFPTIRPSLLLDFANSKQVDPRISFTRASTATYYDAQGVLRTAASGAPRIDHDPTTGECKGLLIAETRTNLLTYSEDFNNAAWVKIRLSVTTNATVSPDGTLTADKIVEDTTTSSTHYVVQTCSVPASTAYTFTVYLKAAERTRANVLLDGASGNFSNAYVDLSAGTVISWGANGTFTGHSSSMTPVGNGWYRLTLTSTVGAGTTSLQCQIRLHNSVSESYTGNGSSGIYVWGAQLEAGSFPTSYIPTTTAQVTRAADVVTMTETNFSEWYRQDEGTFVIEYILSSITTTCGVMAVSDGTDANCMIVRGGSTGATTFIGVSGGATQYNDGFASGLANVSTLVAFGYKTNAFVGTRNGAAPITDVSCVVPTVSMLRLGADGGGALPLNGHIRRIAYYPVKLSSSQLQALTTP